MRLIVTLLVILAEIAIGRLALSQMEEPKRPGQPTPNYIASLEDELRSVRPAIAADKKP